MTKDEEDALKQITLDSHAREQNHSLPDRLAKKEKNDIQNALYETDGNQTLAARKLGIGRTCLIAKMKKYNLI